MHSWSIGISRVSTHFVWYHGPMQTISGTWVNVRSLGCLESVFWDTALKSVKSVMYHRHIISSANPRHIIFIWRSLTFPFSSFMDMELSPHIYDLAFKMMQAFDVVVVKSHSIQSGNKWKKALKESSVMPRRHAPIWHEIVHNTTMPKVEHDQASN